MDAIQPYLPFLIPILVIQLGLMVFALVDLVRRPESQVKFSKWVWAFIIVFINIIGPLAYFLIGREEG